jgi:hypothetical protein
MDAAEGQEFGVAGEQYVGMSCHGSGENLEIVLILEFDFGEFARFSTRAVLADEVLKVHSEGPRELELRTEDPTEFVEHLL